MVGWLARRTEDGGVGPAEALRLRGMLVLLPTLTDFTAFRALASHHQTRYLSVFGRYLTGLSTPSATIMSATSSGRTSRPTSRRGTSGTRKPVAWETRVSDAQGGLGVLGDSSVARESPPRPVRLRASGFLRSFSPILVGGYHAAEGASGHATSRHGGRDRLLPLTKLWASSATPATTSSGMASLVDMTNGKWTGGVDKLETIVDRHEIQLVIQIGSTWAYSQLPALKERRRRAVTRASCGPRGPGRRDPGQRGAVQRDRRG